VNVNFVVKRLQILVPIKLKKKKVSSTQSVTLGVVQEINIIKYWVLTNYAPDVVGITIFFYLRCPTQVRPRVVLATFLSALNA